MRLILLFLLCFISLNGQPIKAVIFDFGNVIAKPEPALVVDFLVTSCRTTEEEAKRFLENLWSHERAGGDEESFLATEKANYPWLPMGAPFWRRQWSRIKSIAIQEIPGMLDLVMDLQKNGYITPLFSNVSCGVEWIESVKRAGYYDCFNPLFLSNEMGVRKPDRKAFEMVLEKLQLAPEACLLIDDKPENVEAALQMGMEAIQFENILQLKQELKAREIHG